MKKGQTGIVEPTSEPIGKITEAEVREIANTVNLIKGEIRKAFFGHEEIVDSLMR